MLMSDGQAYGDPVKMLPLAERGLGTPRQEVLRGRCEWRCWCTDDPRSEADARRTGIVTLTSTLTSLLWKMVPSRGGLMCMLSSVLIDDERRATWTEESYARRDVERCFMVCLESIRGSGWECECRVPGLISMALSNGIQRDGAFSGVLKREEGISHWEITRS